MVKAGLIYLAVYDWMWRDCAIDPGRTPLAGNPAEPRKNGRAVRPPALPQEFRRQTAD
jgi:hypothetical protein